MEELDGENIEQFEEKSSSRLCSFVLDMHFHLFSLVLHNASLSFNINLILFKKLYLLPVGK